MSDILSKPLNPLIRRPGDHQFKLDVPRPISDVSPNGNPCGEVSLGQPVKTTLETFKPLGEAWPFGAKENVSEPVKTVPKAPPALEPIPDKEPARKRVELKAPEVPKLEPIKETKKVVELPTIQTLPALQVKSRTPELTEIAKKVETAEVAKNVPTSVTPSVEAKTPNVAVWATDEDEFIPVVPKAVSQVKPPEEAPIQSQSAIPAVPVLTPIAKTSASETKVEIPALDIKRRDIYGYVILGYGENEFEHFLHGIYLPDQLNRMMGVTLQEKLTYACESRFEAWNTDDNIAHRKRSGHLSLNKPVVENGAAMNLMAKLEVIDDGSDNQGHGPYVIYTFRVIRFKMNDLGTLNLSFIP